MDIIFLGFFGFFTDMVFILKVFVLVAIIGFLNQHMQNQILKIILFMFMAYFILIVNWGTFGTIWVIYTVLGLGVSGVLVDLFFVSVQGGHDPSEGGHPEGAEDSKGNLKKGDFPGSTAPGAQAKNAVMVKKPMFGR